eukprot:jgi/Chlat1/4044/Chrsp26S04097
MTVAWEPAGDDRDTFRRVPTDKPPFTVGDLKRAIPAHCFERSLLKSSVYLGTNLAACVLAWYCTRFFQLAPAGPIRWLLWAVYWVVQGCLGTGVWVIAHECGHGAFSRYPLVNDTVGLVFHSALLVPFFSWKYSHRRHHSNTGNLAADEVFVPGTIEKAGLEMDVHDTLIGRIAGLFFTLTMGWPAYLVSNMSGRPYPKWANHFDPYSPIFNRSERLQVLISDIALAVVCGVLYLASRSFGTLTVVQVYGVPYLIVNFWLVLITLLQHTHPSLPHYSNDGWDWLRGALCTVDRDYGILNTVFHHIGDTHVTHHLFSTLPHYHALEATAALKPILGDYYLFDSRPVFQALWSEWVSCRFVAPDSSGNQDVLWFANRRQKLA